MYRVNRQTEILVGNGLQESLTLGAGESFRLQVSSRGMNEWVVLQTNGGEVYNHPRMRDIRNALDVGELSVV